MEEKKNKTSRAKLEANKRWHNRYWRPNVSFPDYVKDWMADLGIENTTAFIRETIIHRLEEMEKEKKPYQDYHGEYE